MNKPTKRAMLIGAAVLAIGMGAPHVGLNNDPKPSDRKVAACLAKEEQMDRLGQSYSYTTCVHQPER